jgi:hypothetical protein
MWIKISSLRLTHRLKVSLILICLISLLITWMQPAKATHNILTTTKFAYGARIDPWGEQVDFALKSFSSSGLDWLGIDFDWKKYWSDRDASLDLSRLDQVMSYANEHNILVLFSITNPPAWVITESGPDPIITTGLVAQLVRLYPDTLMAVELFPSANTQQGWGSKPNPRAYTGLLQNVAEMLRATGTNTVLVAAGLTPIASQNNPGDMDDLKFLKQLYLYGAANNMPIIGIRFLALSGDPLDAPWGANSFVVRHYELIRNEMLEHNHAEGRIWITGFGFPAMAVSEAPIQVDRLKGEPSALANFRSRWLNQAFYVMKSQLYLGAAFFNCLNPPAVDLRQDEQCLIQDQDGQASLHPAFSDLSRMISLENSYHDQINDPDTGKNDFNSIYSPTRSSP